MIVIGLTGGIASGKSTVGEMLKEQGVCFVDADVIARTIVQPGKPAWKDVVAQFGPTILLDNEQLDRKELGDRVFHDAAARKTLEKITHPRIREAVEQEFDRLKQAGVHIAVLDAPLLIESNWLDLVDTIWLVFVEPKVQLERLMLRNSLSREDALARINAQMPLSDKKMFADIIIDNGRDVDFTRQQVMAAWRKARFG